ncbi:MAG TPA: hypothetical protein DCZ86_05910 [Candidatus Moranbacteria bacterium]|uniref:Uncharacterized protein n=1 Tax=Candidatus Tagabacteria bacterium RIFCSPLOWO2_01_FULL_42_9 TaxID=1802296 RepID=A0A1G2LW86_9BACT|nr:MAG: hypothetical protein A3A10_00725 [Candidatus Tagabacteria bacterium RIFCSPLOWO2_01_FULL_42_9]HBB37498.1 hypothetical protein [Candidatus Moranbacteria bacterium]
MLEIVASFREAKTAKEPGKTIGPNHILILGGRKIFIRFFQRSGVCRSLTFYEFSARLLIS